MSRIIFILIFVSTLVAGCSSTRSLKEGEVLYRGERIKFNKDPKKAKWKIDNSGEKYANVYWALWDAPNGALLGMPLTSFFPLRLFIYNDFYNDKSKGFSYWIRQNFGEAPKTIQGVNPELKLKKGISIFEEYGHFGTGGHYKLNYNKKGNKAYLRYYFNIKRAYTYRRVMYEGSANNKNLNNKFRYFEKTSAIRPLEEFNLYKIRAEKTRMVKTLQDSGYYFIRTKDILISADTTLGNKTLDLKISMAKNLPQVFYKQQYLNDVQIKVDSVTQTRNPGKFYDWGYGKIKTRVLDSIIDIKSNSRYSLSDTKRTNFLLSELGVFSDPRIDYSVQDGDSITLDPVITLQALDATNIGFNVRGNYKNSGYIGPSVGITFRQLNVFHGAENLTVNADAYYDFPFGRFRDRISDSYGFSLRSLLTIPLLRAPFKFINHKFSLPKQFYRLNLEFNIRRDYFDLTTINASYGWTWKSRPNITHTVGLVDVTLSNIKNPTQRFDDLIDSNPLLAATLINQFMVGQYYEFNFDRPATTYQRLGIKFTGRVDASGNAINLIGGIFSKTPQGERTFLGLKYAQFTRFTSNFVTNWHISKTHQLVFRNVAGIGLAYGNSESMPFIRQYFIGGSNSLRPINARLVGPGRFLQIDESEVNQVGDFKLEFNLEYRMPLIWKLNFAIFIDMGNIWLLKPDPNRPGGEVRWNKLFNDMYVTSGIGLRLDIDYLVLRLDAAAILRLPIAPEGKQWAWQFNDFIWGPVIGIGYPF